MDAFIAPRMRPAGDRYEHWSREIVSRSWKHGKAELRREAIPYDARRNEYVVGCWLQGNCPECGASAGGYGCENCGMCFSPRFVRHPQSRLHQTHLESRVVQSVFLLVDPDEMDRLAKA